MSLRGTWCLHRCLRGASEVPQRSDRCLKGALEVPWRSFRGALEEPEGRLGDA